MLRNYRVFVEAGTEIHIFDGHSLSVRAIGTIDVYIRSNNASYPRMQRLTRVRFKKSLVDVAISYNDTATYCIYCLN